MNRKLRKALLCGDQCHCWKIGHGKQGSEVANVCIANGVEGVGVIIWRVLDSYCHGNLMR